MEDKVPPEGEKDPTQEVETITIAKSDHDALIVKQKAHDTAGFAGRKLQEGQEKLKAGEDALKLRVKEHDEAVKEAAKDDPDALTRIEALRKERETKEALTIVERERDETKEENVRLKATTVENALEQTARSIATKAEVDEKKLIQLASKYTDGSKEAIEELAKELPKKGIVPDLKVDSGKGSGGGEMPDSAMGKMKAGWDEVHKK